VGPGVRRDDKVAPSQVVPLKIRPLYAGLWAHDFLPTKNHGRKS
jgi:hypothetical protein